MTQQEFEHIAPVLRSRLKDVGQQFFGDEEMAEDIAQETLMRLWMLRDKLKPQAKINSLALRMAKNLCISEWRKQKVRQGDAMQVKQISHEDIHRDLEMKEEIARLRQAVSLLKPAEQRLFRMRHEAEMDIQQISTVSGIGVRSVSAMLSTAKRKLLEILYPKGGKQ